MKFRRIATVVAALAVPLLAGCKDKAKEARKAAIIEIMHGNTPDADITAAIAKARETVGEFLAAMQKPAAGQRDFMVKMTFPAEKGKQQILWVNQLSYDGKLLHGKLDDNTARPGSGVGKDGSVTVEPAKVADWMYNDNGKAAGGWMLRAFKKKFPDEWKNNHYDEKITFKE